MKGLLFCENDPGLSQRSRIGGVYISEPGGAQAAAAIFRPNEGEFGLPQGLHLVDIAPPWIKETGAFSKHHMQNYKTTLLITLLSTAVLLGAPARLAAQSGKTATESKKAQTEKPKDTRKGMPLNGKIAAIDKTAKTITLEGKEKGRVFYLTAQTRITVDGQPAKLDDLKVGEKVGGYARENPDGKRELASLNQGAKAPSQPKKPKTTAAKKTEK